MSKPANSQSIADAMADAETLRLVAATEWGGMTIVGSPFILHRADSRRGRGRASLTFEIKRGRYYAAGRIAAECAHNAFIAVPSLRGEE